MVQDTLDGLYGICSSLPSQGGSNYWILDIENTKEWPAGAPDRARVPLAGAELTFRVLYDNVQPRRQLDRAAILHGLELMARLHPRHFAAVLCNTADAATGDVFLQLCLFNEVVFG